MRLHNGQETAKEGRLWGAEGGRGHIRQAWTKCHELMIVYSISRRIWNEVGFHFEFADEQAPAELCGCTVHSKEVRPHQTLVHMQS